MPFGNCAVYGNKQATLGLQCNPKPGNRNNPRLNIAPVDQDNKDYCEYNSYITGDAIH